MGLLDRIKQKREMESKAGTPAGRPLSVSTEEEFIETCRGLTTDFLGIMFLSGEIEGEHYSASLIVERGSIVGATFEYGGLIMFREQSIEEMKNKLRGSKGGLQIYEFDGEDMQKIRESNKTAFTAAPVPLEAIGIKLTLMFEGEKDAEASEEESSGGIGLPRMRPMNVSGLFKKKMDLNLLELARRPDSIRESAQKPAQEPKVDEEDLGFSKSEADSSGGLGMLPQAGLGGDRKLEEMRRIREERQKKVADLLAKGGVKKKEEPAPPPEAGKPVQTTIDRLYSLVKKYQKLRIDDKLAHTLGVTRAQIEEWAVILEEHDLIELHYPTIGEPEIKMKDSKE